MKLPDKVYDVLKWLLLTFVPALLLFIPSLAEVYGWDTLKIVQTIAIVTEFLGTILGIGSVTYAKASTTVVWDDEEAKKEVTADDVTDTEGLA